MVIKSPNTLEKSKRWSFSGRVQSVALRLVAEREKEIINFVPESYFKTLGQFSKSDNSMFTAKYSKNIDEDENLMIFGRIY